MKIKSMLAFVLIHLLVTGDMGLTAGAEKSLRKDLVYYQKVVKQKKLNLNERIYLLERILNKYDGQNRGEIVRWKDELAKLKDEKNSGMELDELENNSERSAEQTKARPEVSGLLTEGKNSKDYVISAGDLLGLSVFPAEELNRDIVVQPDGNISLPLIGKIMAAGLTIGQLSKVLTKELSFYVANPQVSITVKRFSQRSVFVLGEVARPGVYEYRDDLRLWELITQAGGLTEHAIIKSIKIYRGKDMEKKVIPIDLGGKEKSKDFLLEVGDIIDIPRGEKEIYVFGEVNKPGSYEHKEKLKIVELVSLAGGTTPNAVIRKIRVFRGDGKKRQMYVVNLSEILDKGRLDKDIDLMPGDIVYVPQRGAAKGASWLNNFLPWISMINFVLLLAIYL